MAAPASTTKLKCYIHEMRSPLEPPFDPRKHRICPTCQTRLLEMAKAGTRFTLGGQIVTLSAADQEVKEPARKHSPREIAT